MEQELEKREQSREDRRVKKDSSLNGWIFSLIGPPR